MQLTLDDLRALPLAAAFVDSGEDVVVHTPEWEGAGAGCVEYPVRGRRLVVATLPADHTATALAGELLALLDAAASDAPGAQRSRVRMVAASCRLLCGRNVGTTGSSEEVLRLTHDGIRARAALSVEAVSAAGVSIAAPEVVALVLVQLAVNAAVHGGATGVRVEHRVPAFEVSWSGRAPAPPSHAEARVVTSRRHHDRRRWGLGFARIAADALGGTVYPPRDAGGGRVESTFELGLGRLALPLAAVRGEHLLKANHAWEEETGLLPGDLTLAAPRLEEAVRAAASSPGSIASVEGWAARRIGDVTWVAIPPDGAGDRLRDLLDGLVHERALMDGLPVATQATLRAVSLALGVRLGRPVPRMPAAAWRRRMQALLPRVAPQVEVPDFDGVGALDADVSAVLAARAGGCFEVDGDAMWLRVQRAGDDPLVGALADGDAERVRVG